MDFRVSEPIGQKQKLYYQKPSKNLGCTLNSKKVGRHCLLGVEKCVPPSFETLWGKVWRIGQYNHMVKVHIFWEGHKILGNLHVTFDWLYIGQK